MSNIGGGSDRDRIHGVHVCSPLGVTEEDAVRSLCVSACQLRAIPVFVCSLSYFSRGGLYNECISV